MVTVRKFFFLFILLSAANGFGSTYTVTNTLDSGTGSLRTALTSAITHSGSDLIVFNIPTSDAGYSATEHTWTITLSSDLLQLFGSAANGTIIDGTTQTTAQGDLNPNGPEIVLDGVNNTLDYGFCIYNVSNCVIKGITIKRFIDGIQIAGTTSKNNVISGNYIGTNFDATDSAGNNIGVEIIGGPKFNTVGGINAIDKNVVSGNRHIGIRIASADSNNVFGNFVGVDRTGTLALKNYDGVSIEGTASANNIGGTIAAKRNVVSGNDAYGIPIIGNSAKYNKIIGNYIGTDVNGTAAIPNTYGVLFDDQSSYNIVGGDSASYRNIISGNSGYGVFVYNFGTHNNIVKGNYIGTDKTGTLAVPNGNGIVIDGGPIYNVIDKNVISGNAQEGMVIHSTWTDSNTVTRNYIGTDYTGLLSLPNVSNGVTIAEGPKYNVIGGPAGMGNIIAFNGGAGVLIMTSADLYDKISCNSIHNNVGLGIDLFPPGVNLNDVGDTDSGPNMMMNYPVITNAIYRTFYGDAVIEGNMDTPNPQNVNVEIFIADADSTAYGQGKTYVGCISPMATGNWGVELSGINAGDVVTTTATDALGNTSEFSLNKYVGLYSGINEYAASADINIYPNPSAGFVTITMNNTWNSLSIMDVSGREVYKTNYSGNKISLDLSALTDGIYVAKINGDRGEVCRRFALAR